MTTPNAPLFLTPAVPGSLSNKRGANTGADALALTVKYTNPRNTGDTIGGLRIVATKPSAASGGPAVVALDTWWMGQGTQTTMPVTLGNAGEAKPTSAFFYGGRIYLTGTTSAGTISFIISAPLSGPNVGAWRYENLPPALIFLVSAGGAPASAAVLYSMAVNATLGFVYLIGSTSLYYAQIQSDGTFGTWFLAANQPAASNERWMISWSDNAGNSWLVSGSTNTNTVTYSKLNSDGSPAAWSTTAAATGNQGRCGLIFAANNPNDGGGTLYLIGGYDGASILSTIRTVAATVAGGVLTLGTPTVAGTGIPAARQNMGCCLLNGIAYLSGGDNSGATTTVYRLAVGSIGSSAWTTDAIAQPSAGTLPTFASVPQGVSPNTTVGPQNAGDPTFVCVGGGGLTMVARVNPSTGALTAYSNGAIGSPLSAANLNQGSGVNGTITNNSDGTVTVTYTWAAAPLGGTGNSDGDILTITAFTVDNQGGDASPAAVTALKIGQVPVLSSLLPSGAGPNGQPMISFLFSAGTGGGSEGTWRAKITGNTSSKTYADSGVRVDQSNTWLPLIAPMLDASETYTLSVTVTSADTPENDGVSSNQTISTATFSVTGSAPSAPTGLSATPDHINGLITLIWTNPSPPATPGNRVYYRQSGTVPWFLLKDSAVGITTFSAMDQLSFGVAYDFAVSQLNLTAVLESILSNIAPQVVINPPIPSWGGVGYTAMLHVVGNGLAQHAGLLLEGVDVNADRVIEETPVLLFGASAPVVRFGKGFHRLLKVNHVMRDSSVAVDAIIDAARTGSILCFREKTGLLVYCTVADPPGSSASLKPRFVTKWGSGGHSYLQETIALLEVSFAFAP